MKRRLTAERAAVLIQSSSESSEDEGEMENVSDIEEEIMAFPIANDEVEEGESESESEEEASELHAAETRNFVSHLEKFGLMDTLHPLEECIQEMLCKYDPELLLSHPREFMTIYLLSKLFSIRICYPPWLLKQTVRAEG